MNYQNYRWEPANKKKRDKFYYVRTASLSGSYTYIEEQRVATVAYQSDNKFFGWGKWTVVMHGKSPALYDIQKEGTPVFANRKSAMNWVEVVVRLA